MEYFVKNLEVHKYLVPARWKAKYTGETLRTSVLASYEKCDDCFGLPR